MYRSSYHSLFLALGITLFAFSSEAQQLKLGNNPTQMEKSAALQIDSKNQGVLLPRLSTWTGIDAITPSPPDGMIVYFTDGGTLDNYSTYGPNAGLYIRKDGTWKKLVTEDKDKVGITSLNGDETKDQKLTVSAEAKPISFLDPASGGTQVLNIPDASDGIRGVVNTTDQSFKGTKTFLSSPQVSTLHPGSVVFIGDDHSLSEKNASFFWNNTNDRLGIGTNTPGNSVEINSPSGSGLRLTHLPGTSTDRTATPIGVNSDGDVVRIPSPIYYNHNGILNIPSGKNLKVWIDSIKTSTATATVTFNISSAGFTKILDIQATAKRNNATYLDQPIASISDYSNNTVVIHLVENQHTGLLIGVVSVDGLEDASNSQNVIFLRVEGY